MNIHEFHLELFKKHCTANDAASGWVTILTLIQKFRITKVMEMVKRQHWNFLMKMIFMIDDFYSSSSEGDIPPPDDQTSSQCLKPCRKDDRTSPFQQVGVSVLVKTRTVYGSGKKRKERSFQSSWLKHFNWLVFVPQDLRHFIFIADLLSIIIC